MPTLRCGHRGRRPAGRYRRARSRRRSGWLATPPTRPPPRATSGRRASGFATPLAGPLVHRRPGVRREPVDLAARARFRPSLKPVSLSGSRGVMRVDEPPSFPARSNVCAGCSRAPDIRAERNAAHELRAARSVHPRPRVRARRTDDRGRLRTLAVFDKPDPLDGPFFEETIYVTPSPDADASWVGGSSRPWRAAAAAHRARARSDSRRVPRQREGVFVLEVAARPIGGLCARGAAVSSS